MLKKRLYTILFICLFIFIAGILGYRLLFPGGNKKDIVLAGSQGVLPYTIILPETILELPEALTEISGISYYDDRTIACCEDETGTIYLLDIESGEITHTYEFSKDGDYEDIEVVEDTSGDMETKFYVLSSSGNIFRVKRPGQASQKVKKYRSFLNEENDAEGLCYYKKINGLLITCKGLLLTNAERAIYVFDLNKKVLLPEPLFVFNLNADKQENTGNISMFDKFQPSGIAIHPKTGNFYIISSSANLLLVINPDGKMISLTPLEKDIFIQPEGICFFPNGDMYISNEGRWGKGNIVKFTYNN